MKDTALWKWKQTKREAILKFEQHVRDANCEI